MSSRILHVSDLHLGGRGGRDKGALETALAGLIEHLDPALVIASGDLTHRGRRAELEAARDLLDGLGRPVLAVPGNHDIPLWPPARLAAPWRRFEDVFETTEPLYSSPELVVVGLNSAQPFRHQGGRVARSALARACARLETAPPGACRVAVFHHNLLAAPWRARKRPLDRRGAVLDLLLAAGVELIAGGHIHQATASEGREFRVGDRPVVATTAPGFTRPRPQRRGEAQGALAYVIDETAISAETLLFGATGFELTAVRRFPRGAARLAEECHAAVAGSAAA